MENKTPTSGTHDEILLTSLAEFWSLIEPLLAVVPAKHICEIGMGRGKFTAVLIDYCKGSGGCYTGIDPSIDPKQFSDVTDNFVRIIQRPSLSVLGELAPQDVYFLDGDHNYHTVRNELRLIVEAKENAPLIMLHDLGWPWARRDQYCEPSTVPESARHSSSTDLGVIPGQDELGTGGFSGEASDYLYAAANHEGGPRNGVLTAVEDFLREPAGAGWRLLVVPAIFGLGILYAPEKMSVSAKAELMRLEAAVLPLQPLLKLMERNRVELFLAYLRQLNDRKETDREYKKLHVAYDELAVHARDLLGKYNELRAHAEALEAANKKLRE